MKYLFTNTYLHNLCFSWISNSQSSLDKSFVSLNLLWYYTVEFKLEKIKENSTYLAAFSSSYKSSNIAFGLISVQEGESNDTSGSTYFWGRSFWPDIFRDWGTIALSKCASKLRLIKSNFGFAYLFVLSCCCYTLPLD